MKVLWNFCGLPEKPELYGFTESTVLKESKKATKHAKLLWPSRKPELYNGSKKATKTFHCVKAEFSICCCVYTCCYTFCPRHYHASNTALLARHIVVVL